MNAARLKPNGMSTTNKDIIRQIYDALADDYDHPANFFTHAFAKPMLNAIDPAAGSRLLDAGAGTGVFALYAAKKMPEIHVTGIDLSALMLDRARKKARERKLGNVEFKQMDMTALTFPDNYFDAITCCSSIYFLDDMAKGLKHMSSKIRPNGKIAANFFGKDAFLPLSLLFKRRYALFRPESDLPEEPWEKLSDTAFVESLYHQAGIGNVSIWHEPLGFHLDAPETWWDIIWNTGYRYLLNQLSISERSVFKQRHMAEIASLCEKKPRWIDASVTIVVGSAL
uniref:Ubiquinone/menaquinone biosynthesis C-methylase UbiE n=1 Tax=Candidatus Kentrum sp. TC TaxID=2126339 RepID=A0A450ZWT8_9GAMM|nr:MAG: Ubiquinone/menaquinone biosynthesis C-methylase UbiE [Candidatus Kentron sp. TC]